ncbi:hypothetical protein I4F81_002414 [Pyropia yezoensis]|uniref:Uncharacterized protein n=1 Tax=Pyropia yezoensis TaxID=2788 RepID=A0ACC3BQ01_PYRYE|nr:hypothetical protein I4F81_002414 [Neopyropia yezoensis]
MALPPASPAEAAASLRTGVAVRLVTSVAAATAAAAYLSTFRTLAVDCEGVALSRSGRLCLVQIASPRRAYLFDTVTCAGVLAPVRALLEDPSVTKLLHDCRHDADALAHQAGVLLAGVRDTQVAYGLLVAAAGHAHSLPVSLSTLLRKYAPASVADVALKAAVKARFVADPGLWAARPLDADALAYAVVDVQHLFGVFGRVMRSLDAGGRERVAAASELYCRAYREGPEGEGPAAAKRDFERL